jgi:rSAM/selenodomain-associated transferase 1
VSLLVIAKSPQPGRAKTRLSPPCSPAHAASIARAALADTLEALATVRARRHRLVLDGPAGPWVPDRFEVVPQRGGDLGARLAAAVAGVRGPLLLVGMDTPQLRPDLVELAIGRLAARGTDAVLGLAADGGWWGIGLRRSRPEVFAGVPMSRPTTGARQRARLEQLGLRTAALPVLRDVDRFEDALAVAAQVPRSRFSATVRAVQAAT